MNKSHFAIGSINIYYYSLCILLGVILALLIIIPEIKKEKIDEDKFYDLAFLTIIFGVLGARIYYVLFNLSYYSKHIIEIFEVWNGGLAIHGGIIGGLITIYIYTKKNKMNFLKILDIIVPGLILAQSIGRWGNFFNGEAYGPVVSYNFLRKTLVPSFIIKGMKIYGYYHMPTFLYESLWDILGFIIMIILRKKKNLKLGFLTGFYLSYYSLGRFFIELLRTDSLRLGVLKFACLISVVLFVIGLILMIKSKEKECYRKA